MAGRHGPTEVTGTIEDSPGGTARNFHGYVRSGIEIGHEAETTETTGFGDSFREHTPTGIKRHDDIEMTLIWQYKLHELKSFPNLKLIASLGAGVDHLVGKDRHHLPEGVPIVRLVDPSMTTQMTEWCLMAILNHVRQWQKGLNDSGLARKRPISPMLLPDYAKAIPDYMPSYAKESLKPSWMKLA